MNIVFDTETLLAFYLGEPAGKKVERRLVETMKGEVNYLPTSREASCFTG